MKLIDQLRPIAKALIGFITPGVAVLIYATTATSAGGEAITTNEWLLVLGACLGTGATVYAMPNKKTGRLSGDLARADALTAKNAAVLERLDKKLTRLEENIGKAAAKGAREGTRRR